MEEHQLRVQRPGERFPRERELAWRLAELAADPVAVEPEVADILRRIQAAVTARRDPAFLVIARSDARCWPT